MSILESKHIAVRPLPQGYALRVERAPLCLPGYRVVACRSDAYRSAAPLVAAPTPPDDDTSDLEAAAWELRSMRTWTLRTLAICAAFVGLLLLIVVSRR